LSETVEKPLAGFPAGSRYIIMVQQKMQFDRALRPPVISPGEHRKAQGYGSAVQGKQLVF